MIKTASKKLWYLMSQGLYIVLLSNPVITLLEIYPYYCHYQKRRIDNTKRMFNTALFIIIKIQKRLRGLERE